MKPAKFLVKANYIKPAKNEWVLCDVSLLEDDSNTFLCIKTVSNLNDGDNQSISGQSELSYCSKVSPLQLGSYSNRPFTALCNLSQYRSCDIRTTVIQSQGIFALKLVPQGILNQKKLFLASDDERQLTAWLGAIKNFINKKQTNGSKSSAPPTPKSFINDSPTDTLASMSRAGDPRDKPDDIHDLQSVDKFNIDEDADDDEDDGEFTENDIYEPYSVGDLSIATVQDTADSARLKLKGDVYLKTAVDALEISDIKSRRVTFKFPYKYIRRFGPKENLIKVEAGRRCSTGEGLFIFKTDHSAEIACYIREALKNLKKKSSNESALSLNKSDDSNNHNEKLPAVTTQSSNKSETFREDSSPLPSRSRSDLPSNRSVPPTSTKSNNLFDETDSPNILYQNTVTTPAPKRDSYIATPMRGSDVTTDFFEDNDPCNNYDNMRPGVYSSVHKTMNNDTDSSTNSPNAPPRPPRNKMMKTTPSADFRVASNKLVHSPPASNGQHEQQHNGSPAPRVIRESGDPQRCMEELDEVLKELGISTNPEDSIAL